MALDPCEPDPLVQGICCAGPVGDLRRRTLVSSEACPDVDVAVHITRKGMNMAVRVSDHGREGVHVPVKMRA